MENWDDYRLILAIYRGKTLRTAAQLLGINHSTVARRLDTLNKRFGAIVAEASPGGYKLSKAGMLMYQSALRIEKHINEDIRLTRSSVEEISGKITLSVPPPIFKYLLFDEIARFQAQYPHIDLHLDTSYNLVSLDDSEADIVIRAMNKPAEHLVGHRVANIAVNYYGAKDYLNVTSSENYQWITDIHRGDKPSWIESSPYPTASINMRIADLELRHEAANRGLGIVRGACYIAQQFQNLVVINKHKPTPFVDLWVLSHKDLVNTPRIKLLKTYLFESLKAKSKILEGQTSD